MSDITSPFSKADAALEPAALAALNLQRAASEAAAAEAKRNAESQIQAPSPAPAGG